MNCASLRRRPRRQCIRRAHRQCRDQFIGECEQTGSCEPTPILTVSVDTATCNEGPSTANVSCGMSVQPLKLTTQGSGSAAGPVGTQLTMEGGLGTPDSFTVSCGGWAQVASTPQIICQRQAGQPGVITWTLSNDLDGVCPASLPLTFGFAAEVSPASGAPMKTAQKMGSCS